MVDILVSVLLQLRQIFRALHKISLCKGVFLEVKKFLEIKIKFQALGFYLTIFKVKKLTCYCFMILTKDMRLLGQRQRMLLFKSTARSMSIM